MKNQVKRPFLKLALIGLATLVITTSSWAKVTLSIAVLPDLAGYVSGSGLRDQAGASISYGVSESISIGLDYARIGAAWANNSNLVSLSVSDPEPSNYFVPREVSHQTFGIVGTYRDLFAKNIFAVVSTGCTVSETIDGTNQFNGYTLRYGVGYSLATGSEDFKVGLSILRENVFAQKTASIESFYYRAGLGDKAVSYISHGSKFIGQLRLDFSF